MKRDFAAENGDQGFLFTEPVCKKFLTHCLIVHVLDNDQSVEKITMSLSELLWAENGKAVSWYITNLW